ncbi:MAG: hypothetical protein A2939_05805, partial [Parcubacteria group bacterium RIFCSPLOWO2_01_FULL_48_18]
MNLNKYLLVSISISKYRLFVFLVFALFFSLLVLSGIEGFAVPSAHAADFFVQRGYSVIPAGQTSSTITAGVDYTAPASTSRAFIRVVNTRLSGMGLTSLGGTQNVLNYTASIDNPYNLASSVRFLRNGTTANNRIAWEIIEYTGSPGGANEFIVRNASSVNFTSQSQLDTGIISSVQNDNDVAVFITGQRSDDPSTADWGASLFISEWVSSTDAARFKRDDAGSPDNGYVSYAAVEFTGSNWKVQRVEHVYSASGTIEIESIPAPVATTTRAFLHCQLRHNAGLDGLDEQGQECWLSSSSTISFRLQSGANLGHRGVAWIIENTQTDATPMIVQHISASRGTGGAEEDIWTNTIASVASTSVASIMGESGRSAGTGLANPRGSITLFMSSASAVELRQSDSGQTQTYSFSVVEWPTALAVGVSNLTQIHYRWRNNNGDETSATWTAATDTPILNVVKSTTTRLRFEVSNEGATGSAAITYRIEYSTSMSGGWLPVGSTSDSQAHWVMVASQLTEASNTSNVANGLPDENTTFVTGRQLENSNQTAGITLSSSSFTELEYSIAATSTAIDGQTYYFRVTNAGTAITNYSIYASATLAAAAAPNLTQIHYRWRNNNGDETSATWTAATDTPILNVVKSTTTRLRFEISNEGAIGSAAIAYRIEYATSATTTAAAWTPVGASGSSTHWIMTLSQLVDGSNTSNVANGLPDENAAFVAGRQQELSNQTAGITLSSSSFTEIEYSFLATSTAIDSQTYYFRLTDNGTTTNFTYTSYASATLYSPPNLTQIHYRWRNDDGGEGGGTGGGVLDTSFGMSGIVTASSASNQNYDIAIDGTYMYIVGDNGADWRIEKRLLSTGAGDTGFGTNGVVTSDANSVTATGISIDGSYMYVVGWNSSINWRIEKRRLSDGALCTAANCGTAFDTDGIIDGDAASELPNEIAIDSTYMYVVGYNNPTDFRIEKRRLSDGALCTAANCGTAFGANGILISSSTSNNGQAIAIDFAYMYVVGDTGFDWYIEKRLLSTGAGVSGFGVNGVIIGSSTSGLATAIAIDSTYMYVVGDDGVLTQWRIEKRLLSTGAGDAGFGANGVVSASSATDRAQDIAIDDAYMYITGQNNSNDMRIEKRLLSNGAGDSGFGANGVVAGDTATDVSRSIAISSSTGRMYVVTHASTDWRIEKRFMHSGATWAAAEDTSITGLAKYTSRRLRFEVVNSGLGSTSTNQFRLEYATSATATTTAWTQVGAAGAHWQMYGSPNFIDGASTTNVDPGLSDATGSIFTAGQIRETTNPAGPIGLDGNQFTEIEYAIQAFTDAIDGQTYYFRVMKNVGIPLDAYTIYASATLASGAPVPNLTQIHYRWRNDDGGEGGGGSWSTSTVDSDGSTGQYVSIGTPDASTIYISYYNASTTDLMFAKSTNGGNSWSTTTIDSDGIKGQAGSLVAPASSTIYISYLYNNGTSDELMFARSSNGGTSWTTSSIAGGNVGSWSSIDAPVGTSTIFISYWDEANSDLAFAKSTNGGDSWATSRIDGEGAEDLGAWTSIDAPNNQSSTIFVSYRCMSSCPGGGGGDLLFALSSNGGNSWSITTVDRIGTTGDVGFRSSIHAPTTSTIYIVYDDVLAVLVAKSVNGGSTWTTSTVSDSRSNASVYALSTSTVYLVFNGPFSSPWGIIFASSSDGGQTWSTSTILSGSGLDYSSRDKKIQMVGSNIVYAAFTCESACPSGTARDLMFAKLGGGGATFAAAEDTPITGLAKQTLKRLRFLIDNAGDATSTNITYRIEYATSTSGPWTPVGSTTNSHWQMSNSAYLSDGSSTTNMSGGLTDPLGATFFAGYVKDASSQTAAITLSSSSFTELEYAIAATSTAIDGQTYYFRVTNAGTEINTYSIYASATLAGGAAAPNLTQIYYRWRDDSALESADSGWLTATNAPITDVAKQTTRRLRFSISNEGGGATTTQYRLEYATSQIIGAYTQVGSPVSTSAHWIWASSANITDGVSTTDNVGLTNPSGKTFTAGQIKDMGSQTGNITVSETQFTELEYSITATTTAINGQTYYFRVTNAGTAINTYSIYASATLAGGAAAPNLTQIHYRWRNRDGYESEAEFKAATNTPILDVGKNT